MAKSVLVRPAGTSWMSVFGGWIATIGAMALIAPAVAGILARADVAPAHAAVPVASPYATPAAARPAPLGRDRVVRQEVVRERRPLIPSLGRKGGERVVERRDEEIERS